MKQLYVGCRVKILWSNNWPELNGTEGLIVDKDGGQYAQVTGWKGDWIVAPDLWGSEWCPRIEETRIEFVSWGDKEIPVLIDIRGVFAPASEQLEPILPSKIKEQVENEELDLEEEKETVIVR